MQICIAFFHPNRHMHILWMHTQLKAQATNGRISIFACDRYSFLHCVFALLLFFSLTHSLAGRRSMCVFINAQNFSELVAFLLSCFSFMKIVSCECDLAMGASATHSDRMRENENKWDPKSTYMRIMKPTSRATTTTTTIATNESRERESESERANIPNEQLNTQQKFQFVCNLFLESYHVRVNGLFSIIWSSSPLICGWIAVVSLALFSLRALWHIGKRSVK